MYEKWFVLVRKSVSTTRNEAFFEKYVFTIRKTASSSKKIEENAFHWKENVFLLKLAPPNFNTEIPIADKKLWTKPYCSHTPGDKFALGGIKDWSKNMFSLNRKVTWVAVLSEKIGANDSRYY